MVTLHALVIVKTGNLPDEEKLPIVSGYINTPIYAFLYKKKLRQFVLFFSRLLANEVKKGQHQQVKHEDKAAYVISRDDYTGILVSCLDYPHRIAFAIVETTMDEFKKRHINIINYSNKVKDFSIKSFNKYCQCMLDKHQDPTESDEILKCLKTIQETKLIMNQVLEKMLSRGEDLSYLIKKSEELDYESYEYYIKARKSNCCILL